MPKDTANLKKLQEIFQEIINRNDYDSKNPRRMMLEINEGTLSTPGVHLRLTYGSPGKVHLIAHALNSSLAKLDIVAQEKVRDFANMLIIPESQISDKLIDETFKETFLSIYATSLLQENQNYEERQAALASSAKLNSI